MNQVPNTLQWRTLQLFAQAKEEPFFPSDIQNAIDSFLKPKSWDEIASIISNHHDSDLLISKEYPVFLNKYKKLTKDLEDAENVFSFDVEYI